jgi:probable tail fiber protein|nr:MAG TPA: tail collar fiber protein [Caudoviricetes sp.]
MAKYISILTDYGTQALAKALANNQPLRLVQFAVGDGNGQEVTPTANRTALVNEKHRANVSAVSIDPRNNKQIIVELPIPENVGGFFVREMGVFDEQNKLIAYANTPESYKPTLESGSGKIQVLRMVLMVSSSNAVTLSVDNSVIFVTRGQLTPHTITATSANSFDQNGHSHAIDKASTTQAGIVQLTDDTGLDSDKLGLTARAGKKLAQWIASLQLALNNYIPNSKKSSRVDSDSTDDVATPKAVKTAYEKAVAAENLAKTKWTAQPATETTAGILPISHKTDGTDKNKFASEFAVGEAAKKGLPVGAIVAFPTAVTNPNGFLRANGATFNASAFPDLYKVLGNSNTLPDLTRSDVGMTAYFAVDNIPTGWIAFDDIATKVSVQTYPELYRHLVDKYGSISAMPKASDRFLRNAANGLQVGQTQEDAIKTHKIKMPDSSYPGKNMGIFHFAERGNINDQEYNELTYNGDEETRPKSLVLKMCIKALNSFDDVRFWVKSHGDVVNIGALDAGRLAQGLQEKADLNHKHTASQITDFNQTTSQIINAAFTYQKIGDFEVRKYPDGTMIQTYIIEQYDLTNWKEKSFNWAQAFMYTPLVLTKITTSYDGVHDCGINVLTKSNNRTCYYWEYEHGTANQSNVRIQFYAIGRWK